MNILLDCGTHLCEGIIQLYRMGIIDDSYLIHAFEANPECNIEHRIRQIPLNAICHNAAVWIKDGYIEFYQEHHKKNGSGSPTDGYSEKDGWASSVKDVNIIDKQTIKGYDQPIIVPSIDFSKFITQLDNSSHIICKMDIEGSEYTVLPHLIQNNTISRIHTLVIEFHSRLLGISKEIDDKLIESIQSKGVNVVQWS